MSNRDKDDVREPLRYALDIHKFEKQQKRQKNDDRGTIPLPRPLATIPQHDHTAAAASNRRAGLITEKQKAKIEHSLARVGHPPINWDVASRVSWFKTRATKASRLPKNPHRPKKYDPNCPYSQWPQIIGRYHSSCYISSYFLSYPHPAVIIIHNVDTLQYSRSNKQMYILLYSNSSIRFYSSSSMNSSIFHCSSCIR